MKVQQQKERLFTTEQVMGESERFLKYVGYELQPVSEIGSIQPDFHARRQSESATYELIGIVRQSLDEAEDAFVKLTAIKAALGESVDYVLVLPPVSEYLTIELFTKEGGRLFYETKRQQFMIWLCNPERQTTTCLVGSTRDNLFNDYFASPKPGTFEQFISMRLFHEYPEDE